MTVSQNGQVSIPADVRARWNTRRVIVVDLGDRIVMRPLPDSPIADLEGKYRDQDLAASALGVTHDRQTHGARGPVDGPGRLRRYRLSTCRAGGR